MKRLLVASMALVLALPNAGFGAVSPQYREFAEGPAQFYMTSQERAAWKAVQTDEEAERFVELFWARRDPTPQTAANEFRSAFEARVRVADENFREGRTPGSMTDRGRVFITLGGATRRQRSGVSSDRVSSIDTGLLENSAAANQRPTETWHYEAEQIPSFAPTRTPFQAVFVDQYQNDEYKLNRGGRFDVGDLMQRAANASVLAPDLTWEQLQARRSEVEVQPAAAAAAPRPTALTNPALVEAVSSLAADATATPNSYLNWGEYVTADGEYYVPVQFYLRDEAGVAPGTSLTLFGEVRDAEGNVVRVVEEPVTALESKGDVYAGTSLDLEPGQTYTGVFGLAAGDRPVALTRNELKLEGVQHGEAGVSQLILSNNIYPLTEAQNPTDPYSFGGIRVVPKGDRTFANDDELWYFYEVRNPAVDANGEPQLQASIEVEGNINGKKRTMRSPIADVAAQPLKGVENHYGVGSSIPLESFEPGTYTFTLRVIDTLQKKNWTMKETFEVVAAE